MFNDCVFMIALLLVLGGLSILVFSHLFMRKNDDTIDDIFVNNVEIEYVDDFPEDIVNVPGYDLLYYSIETGKVYKVFIKDDIEYLDIFTINNHLCKYINGKIMEVVDDKIIAIVHTAVLPN